jgi:hypothetical protein
MITSSPEKLAEWFNKKIPDACRKIVAKDVTLMTRCNLIGRFNYIIRQDLETIRGVLLYEQLREKQSEPQDNEKKLPTCKMCHQPLLPNPEGKPGRPKEYCHECEPYRNKERQKRSHHRRRKRYQ